MDGILLPSFYSILNLRTLEYFYLSDFGPQNPSVSLQVPLLSFSLTMTVWSPSYPFRHFCLKWWSFFFTTLKQDGRGKNLSFIENEFTIIRNGRRVGLTVPVISPLCFVFTWTYPSTKSSSLPRGSLTGSVRRSMFLLTRPNNYGTPCVFLLNHLWDSVSNDVLSIGPIVGTYHSEITRREDWTLFRRSPP